MSRRSESPKRWSLIKRLRALFPPWRRRAARSRIEEILTDAGEAPFDEDERRILKNALALRQRRVEDVMVPRAQVVAVEEKTPMREALALVLKAGHSRLPVYRGRLDEPVGVIHVKDLLASQENGGAAKADPLGARGATLKSVMRKPLFVPPSMPVLTLLRAMQAERLHLALVIDEHGGTCGLVSIEDLVEEIVGEIEDEHDPSSAPAFRRSAGGAIEADAGARIDDIEKALGVSLRHRTDDPDVNTLGGLVFTHAGRLPSKGDVIRHPSGWRLEVREVDPRRVKRVRLHPQEPRRSKQTSPRVKPA